MELKTKVEKVNDTRVKVETEVDAQSVSSALNFVYKGYANKYKFPGFRPGKAPRPVINNAIGKEDIYMQATEDVLNDAFHLLVEEESLRPVGSPNYENKENEALIEDKKPFHIEFELEVSPVVELDSYDPIEAYLPPTEATEDDMKQQIDMYKSIAKLEEDDELTDEIVKEKLSFDSVDDLKDAIKEYVQNQKEVNLPRIKEDVVSLKLRERVNIDPTDEMVDFINDVLLNEMYTNLQQSGATLDQYLAARGISADDFYKDVKKQAYDEAKTRIALDSWVKHFDLQATDAEIDAEFAKAGMTDTKVIKDLWAKTGRLWRLREAIERTKAVENAVESAKFTFDEEKAAHQFDYLNEEKEDDGEEKSEDEKTEKKSPKKTASKKEVKEEEAKDE